MIARWWRGSNGARLNGEAPAPGLMTSMVSAFDILQDRIMRSRLAGDPPDALVQVRVGNVGMFEFHRADELIALGREAIRKAAAEIREHVELSRTERRSCRLGGPSGLSRRDIFAQSLTLAVERVDVALDDVADRDDADQAPVLHDRNMAKPARRHRLP